MLKAMLVAACLALGMGAVLPSLAQEPLVVVPDFPGGGGGGGGFGGANAVTTTNLNVRSGPGTRFPVVHVLRDGERVRISRCSGGWCFTESRGRSGWASENFLRRTGGGGGGGPVRPPNREVCFFGDTRFRGRSFCAVPGESDRNLGSWNNRISSISIRGFATVEVCTDRNFKDCEAFSRDVPFLPWWLERNISAFRVSR